MWSIQLVSWKSHSRQCHLPCVYTGHWAQMARVASCSQDVRGVLWYQFQDAHSFLKHLLLLTLVTTHQRVCSYSTSCSFLVSFSSFPLFFFLICLFIWLHQVLTVVRGFFSGSMQGLVPWPGIKPEASALGAWSLSHWTIREIPLFSSFNRRHMLEGPGLMSP